jgi:hypothetical protein
MPLPERFGRGSFNLPIPLTASTASLTPPVGHAFPTTGHTLAQCGSEIIGITDLSAAIWTLERGVEGTAVSHVAGAPFFQVLTPTNLANLTPPAFKVWLAQNFT